MEIHHFALSQTLAQTNGFLVLFSRYPGQSQGIPPFYQKERNSTIFSVSEPKSALFGPECDFWAPCVKPLINVRFWAPFFDQNRKNAIFHSWDEKSEILLIFHFWGAFCAKNAPGRKSEPKS